MKTPNTSPLPKERVKLSLKRSAAVLTAVAAMAPTSVRAAAPEASNASVETSESPAATARKLRSEAQEHFYAERYDDAVEAFRRAHEFDPHPTDFFNIGRIYEEKGDLAAALEQYEKFVMQPKLNLEARRTAAERIEVLRPLVARAEKAPAVADADAPPPAAEFKPAPSSPPDRSALLVDAYLHEGRAMIISGGVLVGVGSALALAGGVGFGLAARRSSDDVSTLSSGRNPDGLTLSEAEDLHARGKDMEALHITFIASGAAIAVVGAGLVAGGIIKRKRTSFAAIPSAGPGFVGLRTHWRF